MVAQSALPARMKEYKSTISLLAEFQITKSRLQKEFRLIYRMKIAYKKPLNIND